MTELILPVRRDGRLVAPWRQMLDAAAVDGLVDVDVGSAAKLVAEHVDRQLTPLRFIDKSGATRFSTHPSELPDWDPADGPVIATSQRTLWEVATAGDVTDEHGLGSWEDGFRLRRPTTDDQVWRAALHRTTLLDCTLGGLDEIRSHDGLMAIPTLLWATRGSLRDCLTFWNLRALRPVGRGRPPMMLLPIDDVSAWTDLVPSVLARLARPEEFSPDVILASHTVDEADLHRLAAHLGLRASSRGMYAGQNWSAPVRQAPFTYLVNQNVLPWLLFDREYGAGTEVLAHFHQGAGSLRFASPVRFRRVGGRALLRLRSAAFGPYPRRSVAAQGILQAADWYHAALQVGVPTRIEYRFELGLPPLLDVLTGHLRSVASTHELSDKGRLAVGLQAEPPLADLRHPGLAVCVTALTTPRSRALVRDLKRLRAEGFTDADIRQVSDAWGNRGPRSYRSTRDLAGSIGAQATSAAETLAKIGWAERGLEANCPRCGLRSFVPLDTVTGPARCPGCRAAASYTVIGPSLEMYYRLDTFVDRASDQGAVPHVIAAAVLLALDPDTAVLPGVELTFPDGAKAEVDLVGVHAGQIFAGEVKTRPGAFTNEQLDRDMALTARLGADLHILAAPVISPELARRARRRANEAGLQLLVLDASA
ncbi:MAG: hypothetical protein ACJ74O_17945 [Frankiaceae bacterium]